MFLFVKYEYAIVSKLLAEGYILQVETSADQWDSSASDYSMWKISKFWKSEGGLYETPGSGILMPSLFPFLSKVFVQWRSLRVVS
jgi:hypothetical protein